MTRRSRAREVALQLLYQHDLNPGVAQPAIRTFVSDRLRDPGVEPFTLALYEGVLAHQPDIDRHISQAAENWRLARMAVIDRNVLRLGAWELLFTPETPPAAVLNEAIELARSYGSVESPSFVNGVLDKLRQRLERSEARRTSSPTG
jgi:N utilization substance protein B